MVGLIIENWPKHSQKNAQHEMNFKRMPIATNNNKSEQFAIYGFLARYAEFILQYLQFKSKIFIFTEELPIESFQGVGLYNYFY